MDGRADESRSSLRELLEDVLFAGLGAAAITKDRADELVAELTRRGRMAPHEAREVVDEVTGRWRGEALRFGERSSSTVASFLRELGLVTRTEWEELELRLAQVEHRLRLVESERPGSPGAAPPHDRRTR
jgi:polyhydroxyalkanoate synthesis regulator phasin